MVLEACSKWYWKNNLISLIMMIPNAYNKWIEAV